MALKLADQKPAPARAPVLIGLRDHVAQLRPRIVQALQRGGPLGIVAGPGVDAGQRPVRVDGVFLNDYYADGLIISTATGSTAYSMSVGGPIVSPGSRIMLLTPLAPHSLTVRPIVIPDASVVEARVVTPHQPYILAADGRSRQFVDGDIRFVVRRAEHTVKVVKLPEQHYFQTIRSKLMWGAHRHGN